MLHPPMFVFALLYIRGCRQKKPNVKTLCSPFFANSEGDEWWVVTQHRALPRHQRKEMKILNIIPSSGNQTHNLSHLQSHTRATALLLASKPKKYKSLTLLFMFLYDLVYNLLRYNVLYLSKQSTSSCGLIKWLK